RFNKDKICTLIPILGIENILWHNCLQPSSELAICILLYQLSACGTHLKHEIKIFSYSQTYISLVFNDILVHICTHFWNLLSFDIKIMECANAVKKVVGTRGIWGWIDGMMHPFCYSSEDQAAYYSGCKKAHSFQFQLIMTPDRIMSSLHRLYTGPGGDWMMWSDSELETIL
ncbi:hypothetical protein C7212DRAFT_214723, partial [Tuber magnatum]